MTFAHIAAAAGLAGLLLAPVKFPAADGQGDRLVQTTIGVIDVGRAFEQNPRFIKMKQELEAMKTTSRDRLQEKGKAIKELEGAMDLLDPDSDERRGSQLRHELMVRELEGMDRLLREQLERETMVREVAVFEEIDAAARQVAEARGVKLVIKSSKVDAAGDPARSGSGALRARHGALRSRDVLYAADELDLTADVIKRLLVPPPPKGEPEKK